MSSINVHDVNIRRGVDPIDRMAAVPRRRLTTLRRFVSESSKFFIDYRQFATESGENLSPMLGSHSLRDGGDADGSDTAIVAIAQSHAYAGEPRRAMSLTVSVTIFA